MKNLFKMFGLLIILLVAYTAFAGTIKEYSADMVDADSGRVISKLFVTEQKMCMDSSDAGGRIAIIRMDQGKGYVLQEDKTYMEIPIKGDKVPNFEELGAQMMGEAAPKRKLENLGLETISGYQTVKVHVTTTVNMMGQMHTMIHYEWKAKEFDVPLRTQDENGGQTMEIRNIKVGAPDASVFEIPAGYKKNTRLEEMMKQMHKAK